MRGGLDQKFGKRYPKSIQSYSLNAGIDGCISRFRKIRRNDDSFFKYFEILGGRGGFFFEKKIRRKSKNAKNH